LIVTLLTHACVRTCASGRTPARLQTFQQHVNKQPAQLVAEIVDALWVLIAAPLRNPLHLRDGSRFLGN
jgi:hypothetical protein